jgi:hypothetical protein
MDKNDGNFWLVCDRPWSNRSIKGKLLAIADLPGTVTTTAGFKGTVCMPKDWQAILRITAVRLKVEQNQLVGVFDKIVILFDALKGA